jgi:CheY-like chemotaxis protein
VPVHGATQQRSRGRVLIVDDDRAIRELLADVLGDEGYEARWAEHGEVALQVLGEWPADLIVLDMAMPVMDGTAFRAVQLAHPEWKSIPVVVLSATAGFLSEDATIGAKAVLGKPFEVDELLELVGRWITREV